MSQQERLNPYIRRERLLRTVRKWCAPMDSDHADMPHYRWLQLLTKTEEMKND